MAARDVQKLAQLLHERGRVVARREVDEARNEFGTVVEAGASDVAIELHSSGITLTEDDLYFIGTSPAQLDEDDAVLVLAVGSEYAVVGSVETDPDKAASGGHVIQDEGTDLDEQPNLNFTGAAITVTDDPGNDATVVDVQAYTRVRDEGADVTKRSVLDFVGAGVSVADAGGVTTVTIAGGASVADASTTVKGVSKLSTAPASPTDPIAVGDNDPRMTNARTPTAHVHPQSDVTNLVSDLALKAPLASPTFTGTVLVPGTISLGSAASGSIGLTRSGGDLNFWGTDGTTLAATLAVNGNPSFSLGPSANSVKVNYTGANAGSLSNGAWAVLGNAAATVPLSVSTPYTPGSDTATALNLRVGNSSSYTGNNQITFSYDETAANYRQALKTRHNASAGAGNAFDFYLWHQGTNATTDVGTIRALTISTGAIAGTGYVGINSATGSPTYNLDVTGTGHFTGVVTLDSSPKLATNGTQVQFPPTGANIQGDDGSGNSKMTFRAGNVGGNATVYVFRNKADSSDVVAITDGGQVSTIGNVNVSGTSGKAIILNVTSDTLRPNVQLSSNTNANASNLIEFYNTDSSGTVTGARSQEMRAYWRAQDNVSRWAAGMDFNLTATGATGDALGAQIVWRVKSPSEAAGTPTGRMWLDGHSGNAGSTNLSIAGGSYPRLTVGSGNYIERPNASSGLAIVTEALGLQVSGGPVAFAGGAGSKSALNLTSTTVNTGLTIGGDVTLYRSAANVLATDDSLTVDLNLTVNGNARLGNAASDTLGFFTTAGTAQSTGWSVTGGYTADKSFDPESTTTTEVARVLGTLIDAFKAYGLIAA
jgi:hypothetical protein